MKNKNTRTSGSDTDTVQLPAPSAPPSSSPFLTPQQLAARWQCSVVKLRRMRKAGVLPAHAVGNAVRFAMSDIEQLEASWKTGAEASITSPTQEAAEPRNQSSHGISRTQGRCGPMQRKSFD